MTHYVIGADVGTSCLKAALVHPERGVVAVAEQSYPMHRLHPGWAENRADDWYTALQRTVPRVLGEAGVGAAEVAALCLVGQRDIAVLLDGGGDVLAPVIHWTDRRHPDETTRLYDTLDRELLVDRAGTLPIPGLVLPNLVWTREHQPDVWRRVQTVLQPKDYLAYRLTGDIGTDPTGPTRSMLNDWRTGGWSEATCREAGVPRELLPEVRYQPWQVRGELGAAAGEVGLLPGTLLVAGGGDDPAAALGSGVLEPGDVSIGTGSSMSWRAVDESPRFDPTGLVGLMPHVVPGRYLHELVAVGSGTTLRWLRRAFGDDSPYADLIALANTVDIGSDGLLCLPYVEGASVPVQDDGVRAVYHGIAGHHEFRHFIRATLEGIAYQYPDLLDVLRSRGLRVETLTISDGEARSREWNQIKADILGQPIVPALRVEAPAIGAAILAGMGVGAFASPHDGVKAVVELAPTVRPGEDGRERYRAARSRWQRVRNEVFPQFAGSDGRTGS